VGAVDEALREIELAVGGEMFSEALKNLREHAAFNPALIATMRSLVRRIPRRQVVPRCTGTKDPQRCVHDVARWLPRTASLLSRAAFARRDVELNRSPLVVGEVHLPGWITARDRRRSPSGRAPPLRAPLRGVLAGITDAAPARAPGGRAPLHGHGPGHGCGRSAVDVKTGVSVLRDAF
jgi:hypothetical protein